MEALAVPVVVEPPGTGGYPEGFPNCLEGRVLRRLSGARGLENLAVVMVDLAPGSALSMRLWQSHEDEFFYVLEGEATLVTDTGEEPMPAGSCTGFKAGVALGHQIVNKSARPVRLLEMANVVDGINVTDYTGVDMKAVWINGERTFVRRDGTPY
jgi:uncharacterized cupin superfamily protein